MDRTTKGRGKWNPFLSLSVIGVLLSSVSCDAGAFIVGPQAVPDVTVTGDIQWNANDLNPVSEHRFTEGLNAQGWTAGSKVTLERDETAPFGDAVAQRNYMKGEPAGVGIAMKRQFSGQPTTVHIGVVLKISENYVNDAANLTKIFYLWSSNNSKFVLSAHEGQNFALRLLLRSSPGNTGYLSQNTASWEDSRLTPGKWHTVELRVESASAPEMGAAADGRARVWLDGVLTHDYKGLDTHFEGQSLHWSHGEWNTIRGGTQPENPHDMWLWANALFIASNR
jgi:hypothetical protein